MHEMIKEKVEVHNENLKKENMKLQLIMEENIKLKSIIIELKKYIKEL